MLWALLGTSLLAAAPTQLAVTRFRLVQVDVSLGGYAEDRLAAALAKRGFQVTTPADLEAVLGLERQRQLLGCSEDSTACLAEITSALGVPLVATGRLTRLGKRFELDVRVINQKDAKMIASDSRSTDDESRIGDLLDQAAESIASQLLPKAPPKPFRWQLWVPFGVGLASFAAGTALFVSAEFEYASYTGAGMSVPPLLDISAIQNKFIDLSTRRGLGVGLGLLGGALMITGLIWNSIAPDAPVTVSLSVDANRAGLVIGGKF